jgi:hypothetical protein
MIWHRIEVKRVAMALVCASRMAALEHARILCQKLFSVKCLWSGQESAKAPALVPTKGQGEQDRPSSHPVHLGHVHAIDLLNSVHCATAQ